MSDPSDLLNKVFNEDCFVEFSRIPDNFVDLVIADPPYGLGKDYGNDSDRLSGERYIEWSKNGSQRLFPN